MNKTESLARILSTVTWVLLVLFILYAAMWFVGRVQGNLSLVLLITVLVTGVYWVLEKTMFLPARKQTARTLHETWQAQEQHAQALGVMGDPAQDNTAKQGVVLRKVLRQPWWLEWTAGVFPVLLFVFVLRSFVFESFRIPSSSMMPTLLPGDFIWVNKFRYGLRVPVWGYKFTAGHAVQRGDVVVFHFPPDPDVDYIKRVVGLPGDVIEYKDKQLSINGKEYPRRVAPDFVYASADGRDSVVLQQFIEGGGESGVPEHRVLNDALQPNMIVAAARSFPLREACSYDAEVVRCSVPSGHYFVLGDNRDDSLDSRYWGFVPDANVVGKAFFIWMNFSDFGRMGSFQ